MAKRKTPPFRFTSFQKAHSGGKLKSACRRIRVRGSFRYLCDLRKLRKG